MVWSRRRILGGAAVAAGVGGLGGTLVAGDEDAPILVDADLPVQLRDVLPSPRTELLVLDILRDNPRRVIERLVSRTGVSDDEVAVGIGLGLGAFRTAKGRKPEQLAAMPAFPGDVLLPERSTGDMLVQVSGSGASAVEAAADRVQESLGGLARVRWRQAGKRSQNRMQDGKPVQRNPFHFTEGFANPADARGLRERAVVREGQGEPDWAVGGSYQVLRVIRFATKLWDRDSVEEQEKVIGRRRDGRWLDGTPVGDRPEFRADPRGRETPLDAHVRRAASTSRTTAPLVRRSYAYDAGGDDHGLLFSCFQRDVAAGFEAVQKRLEGEALAKYILTVGGGYYFVPPPGNRWIKAAFG